MVNTIITDIRAAEAGLGGRRNKCSRLPSSWAQFAHASASIKAREICQNLNRRRSHAARV